MWTSLAVAAVLTLPAEAGQLELTNARTTYGLLGAPRPDTKYLPGDSYVLAFDINGITVDAGGKVLYSIGMEVTDSAGKAHFKQAPRDLEAQNSLGGKHLPGFVSLQIGLDQPPGVYTVKVTVTDRAAKASQSLTRTYEVLPKAFGLVRLTTSVDPSGQIPAPFLGEGQSLWINFLAVGFGRQKGDKEQPHIKVDLRVLDESGKPTLAKSFGGEVSQDIPKAALSVPMQFLLELNRPGKFTVELKASCKVTGKESATLSFPITVLKAK